MGKKNNFNLTFYIVTWVWTAPLITILFHQIISSYRVLFYKRGSLYLRLFYSLLIAFTLAIPNHQRFSIPGGLDCDFEDFAACDWQNVAGDDADWTERSGSTPSSGTGPSAAFDGKFRMKFFLVTQFS